MSKEIDGIHFEAGFAKHGSKSPYFAMVSGKMFGVEHQFFNVGEFNSSESASEAAQKVVDGMTAIPKEWLARFVVPGSSSSS